MTHKVSSIIRLIIQLGMLIFVLSLLPDQPGNLELGHTSRKTEKANANHSSALLKSTIEKVSSTNTSHAVLVNEERL